MDTTDTARFTFQQHL